MKCSSITINGENRDVQKDPATDSDKKSKAGRVKLWTSGGEFASGVTAPAGWADKGIGGWTDALQTVFQNGALFNEIDFDQVRANAKK
jgi:nicotinamide phosphoribosyltransferase